MSPAIIITIIIAYFCLLLAVAHFTSKGADNDSFFAGNRKSPWYLVAFGMIGASLSGVTFLSIPGWVGNADNQFSYMQVVFGYFVGYMIVAYVLMPIYYRMNLTSIYTYLEDRFGFYAHKTGAIFFLGSRVLGASIRLLLVANVLQAFLFDKLNVPFEVTVLLSIALIWIYTNKGGIKTIIWTDTLQTFFMITAVLVMAHIIAKELNIYDHGMVKTIAESQYSRIFFLDDFSEKNYFWKHFLGGIFIAVGMTGLDQDMMQKNLSCKNIKDAQKNMVSFAAVLILVNLIFLGLGALLYMYAQQTGVGLGVSGDQLFPTIALDSSTGLTIGILFFVGLIAAAYSSADSALTALTTSVSYDILSLDKLEPEKQMRFRKRIHLGVSLGLFLVIVLLKYTTSQSAIGAILFFAGFTYGPLIGMFFFGILTKRKPNDKLIPYACGVAMTLSILLWYFSAGGPGVEEGQAGLLGHYKIGLEMIVFNALFTFIALLAISKNKILAAIAS
ncbi:MAG: SSS family solute:Na+ symporter [Psychromonas sp.]|jgi:SSS family solute:Na+ symporter